MVEKIKDEQAPVPVLKTFESDFGHCCKDDIKGGVWYAHFEHTSDGANKSRAIPLHHSYNGHVYTSWDKTSVSLGMPTLGKNWTNFPAGMQISIRCHK